ALHWPEPPRLMLMTSAGFGLSGTPSTWPPEAQVMASAMSEVVPPQWPSTRTGSTSAPSAAPAMPASVLATASTVPATWVPCQELLEAGLPHQLLMLESTQSPAS